ncbi:unnamed protein product [Acanthoscelides obtectus]|uniref:Protein arginine N-methyltransferase n=1 Tax=Acanthoscelides obtectus TaxID=200917 RepID=A0A9P0LLP8_ACAOB|nr:unnamed protein product [Acanthoscelides obtectus]CAK1675674.1 Protein arginine N-methyltransferase 7 [Acanthoscelides obtectus]
MLLALNFLKRISRNMSVFVQRLNAMSGVNDWVVQSEDYDFHQEVARSAFADMLHDTERNQLYEAALKSAIKIIHSKGAKANVLDIGTGTGLLSMMAARNGADTVTACEAFKPMSDCALKIIARNGFKDKIKVIPKRSTELIVGKDLQHKCNILVTEVFDTELIGEGALSTFKHAHQELLEKDCIVIPQSATIYAQVVESPLTQNWNKLKHIFSDDGEVLIKVPDLIKNCVGSAAVHDMQLSQLPASSINTIISPTPVLKFDWSGNTPFIFERSTISTTKAERDGLAQLVFMWWDLQMDTDGKHILSCAPDWAHPLKKIDKNAKIPWRDHWMQAVYYLPKELPVNKGQEISLISCHDEFSLWFNLVDNLRITDEHYLTPFCECGAHVASSRTRIGQLNDMTRNKKYLALLEKYVNKESTILVLSDCFYCSLAAVKLGANKMYVLETNSLSRRVLENYIAFNKLDNVEIIPSLEELSKINFKDISMVLGEPYFLSSILPWDNLLFIYLMKGVRNYLSNDVQIFPKRASIKAVAMHFSDLHKIRSPLSVGEGFLMKDFDELIEASRNLSDENVEPQPLWEYPGVALSGIEEMIDLDLMNVPTKTYLKNGTFELQGNLDCNGIAIWVDWNLDGTERGIITTGPTSPIKIGENVQWDMYTRQGVCLFPDRNTKCINYKFEFDFDDGNVSFNCS